MKKYLVGLLVLPAVVIAGLLTFRISKDVQKTLRFANTYAIQNVGTGKNVRVRDAGIEDGTSIILYRAANWECMTWRLIQLETPASCSRTCTHRRRSNRSPPPSAA